MHATFDFDRDVHYQRRIYSRGLNVASFKLRNCFQSESGTKKPLTIPETRQFNRSMQMGEGAQSRKGGTVL